MTNPLSARDPSDPLGRTYGQVMREAMEERARAFRARWGDRIRTAPDGRWFVHEDGRLYTLTTPDEGPPWP